MTQAIRHLLLVAAAFLVPATGVEAQSAIDRIYPNGAQRGTSVTLTFGGSALPETAELIVEGEPGIKPLGPFEKGVGKVEIAADAAPGVRQLRLAGAKAATSPRPFSVAALPELLETEPNNSIAQAQKLERLPITLNGVLPTRPDVDVYRVSLKKGECLVAAGESRVLGAPTNLVVRIRDLQGRELLVQMDHRTRDPLLGFVAPEDGDYFVEVLEVMNNYSGITDAYVYRLTLTTGPWIDTVFPAGAQAGQETRLTFNGWNLGGKSGPGSVDEIVTVPLNAGSRFAVTGGGAANRIELAVGNVPEQQEIEPNHAGAPQGVSFGVTVNGTFGERGDRDVFEFVARAGQVVALDVDSRELQSWCDPVMTVSDASGKTLATVDDAAGTRDPRLVWTAPADGKYRVTLRDVAAGARGGDGFFYRLTIASPSPMLRASTPNPTLVLKPGEKVEVPVTVTHAHGSGSITVQAEGLPAGMTAAPVTLTAAGEAKLVLTAAADLKPGATSFRIVARVGELSSTARASWVLSADRSGTLATGFTENLLLLVPAP